MREQQDGGGGVVGRPHHLDGVGAEQPGLQLDGEGGSVDGGSLSHVAFKQVDAGGARPRHVASPQQTWGRLLQAIETEFHAEVKQNDTCAAAG